MLVGEKRIVRPASAMEKGGALASADVRLALAEQLLRSDDLAACAQHCLEWLHRHADVERAVCASLDGDGKRLVGVASTGVSPLDTAEFWIDIEEANHPLIAALRRTDAVKFGGGARHPITPMGDDPFIAVPLGRQNPDQLALGLVLVAGQGVTRSPNFQWVVEILSDKFLSLRSRHLNTESRHGRERALLHNVINAVTDPILLTDPEGRLLIANARAESLFSTRDDDSEGRRRAVSLNSMLLSASLSGRAMDSAEPGRNELLLVDPNDGSDLLFELMSQPVAEPDGEIGIVSVLRNVTDLGRASAEIGESHQKLQLAQAQVQSERHRLDLIIDSVADPIIVTDSAGDIVLMNKPAERLFTARDTMGDEAERRVRANDAHFSTFISNLLFTGTTERRVREDLTLLDPESAEALPVEAVAGRILNERGEVTTVVTILHDQREALEKAKLYEQLKTFSSELEERVQAATAELAQQNELLRRQAIELEQASAAKSQFLANMSHEFRTPLNAILGYTSMLLQGVSGPLLPAHTKSLGRIDSNARHLLEVINEILDITRIESGKMPLNVSSFRLTDLVAEVVAELDPIIQKSPAKVISDIASNIPVMETDRQKVKQILVNLLGNALKFTHQGKIEITARLSGRSIVAVSVQDTGIGIADENHQKVFEDFRQVDSSTTRAYGGTGLGLAICRRLATMLDGKITLKSKLGEGSNFTLYFPHHPKRS